MSQLVDEARRLIKTLESEEFVDGGLLRDFAKRVRLAADELSIDHQQALRAAFNDLIHAVQSHQKKTKERLIQIQSNRRSIRKFSHIRQHSRGQRFHHSY